MDQRFGRGSPVSAKSVARSMGMDKIADLQAELGRLRSTGTGDCYCDTLGETPCAYCQLEQVQKELAEGKRVLKTVPRRIHKLQEERDRLQSWAIACGWMWSKAGTERDAVIERGVRACEEVQHFYMRWREAYEGERQRGRMVLTAERDAKAQRALAERLLKAGVTDYSKLTGANRVDCHFCPGVWRADEPAKHKTTCPLAEALRAGGQEEGE